MYAGYTWKSGVVSRSTRQPAVIHSIFSAEDIFSNMGTSTIRSTTFLLRHATKKVLESWG